jgi:lipopolysaccharide transport system permease protein/teichoic acid transport system permease protein|tara:strand:- start:637 stop:1446 length:810 start_codon:yes stop_codon:yes gene_type:complete
MMQGLKSFVLGLVRSRNLIFALVKRDYKQQNQGSYLGLVWNYLQPLLFVTVLYSIFTLGFRSGDNLDGMPFSVYLVSGMVCWLYFSANLTSITSVIRTYSFLVKKVDFRLSVLPIVKIISTALPHLILFSLTIVLAYYHGMKPGLHTMQFVYYFACMVLLLLGLGWLTSSTSIFVKDISNVVAIVTQFGMWLTPIFWRIETMPENIQWALKLNPVYYVVSGYRDSLTGQTYFWQRPILETLTFWVVTLALLLIGALVFRRLKPHFAEVM